MSWREKLQPCTFRGVTIQVETDGIKVGRRTSRHEYPLRDKPYVEDVGRATREISVTGFLLGDDVHAQRDRLIAATETPGPARFVHPTIGAMIVTCESCEITESTAAGRLLAVVLSLVESGDLEFPAEAAAPAGVAIVANALEEDTGTWLDDVLAIRDQAGAVVDRAVDTCAARIDAARGIMRALGDVATVAKVIGDLDRIAATLDDRILDPVTLVQDWCGVVRSAGGSAAQAMAATHIDDLAASVASADEDDLSDYEQTARDNDRSLDTMFSAAALSAASVVVSETTWTVRDDAERAVSDLDDLMSALEGYLTDRDLAASLGDLRRLLSESVLYRALGLPRLIDYQPGGLESVLEIAQRLYGDYTRAEEIVARAGDKIPHPGFIGHSIEVAER